MSVSSTSLEKRNPFINKLIIHHFLVQRAHYSINQEQSKTKLNKTKIQAGNFIPEPLIKADTFCALIGFVLSWRFFFQERLHEEMHR